MKVSEKFDRMIKGLLAYSLTTTSREFQKPGRAIMKLSKQDREFLQSVTSEDIKSNHALY